MYGDKVAVQIEVQYLYGTVHSKSGRYMEGKKRVVLGEVSSAVETEYEAVVTTNGEKSAEAIVP